MPTWIIQRHNGQGGWTPLGVYRNRNVAVVHMNKSTVKNLRTWCAETGEVIAKGQA